MKRERSSAITKIRRSTIPSQRDPAAANSRWSAHAHGTMGQTARLRPAAILTPTATAMPLGGTVAAEIWTTCDELAGPRHPALPTDRTIDLKRRDPRTSPDRGPADPAGEPRSSTR